MIKKLRRKFILINMLLVSLVLLIVLTTFCLSNYRRFRADSMNAMRRALAAPSRELIPKMKLGLKDDLPPMRLIPTFVVTLDEDSGISDIAQDAASEIATEQAEEAVRTALESGDKEGSIRRLNLRFLFGEDTASAQIAFADTSHEASSLQNLLLTSFVILLGALAAFLFISFYLSRWALRPAKLAWEQQNQFIADASHELKTPLTVILANLNILTAHREEPISSQMRWVDNTRTEASRMKELVENLLFLAKSESGNGKSCHCSLNFSDLCWNCLLPMESLAFEQGVEIEEHISPELELKGDEGQLKQLLIILLDNAFKYAGPAKSLPEGVCFGNHAKKQVTVTLSPAQEKLCLTVQNTGAPIPAQELVHLFERFYRSDKSRVRKEGGYGLGLAIAQTIVHAHGGKISVASSEDTGTTFTVWLPLYPSIKT